MAGNKRRKENERFNEMRRLAQERRELRRLQAEERREQVRKEYARTCALYYIAKRKRFFNLEITDRNISIHALRDVQEFMEEGQEMHHCVFSCGYYDVRKRPYTLILSAKVNQQRAETIEVDLKDFRIVQCRGKHQSGFSLS